MDEASRIVADLQQKLKDLDHKVVQYRHDMCCEFDKFEREILCNVTQEVSSSVTKTIAASLSNYPALYPQLKNLLANNNNTTTQQNYHAPNNSLHADATQDEPPRSPHEREREFTGVFTPSYLPLLDSTDRHERRSSEDMSKAQSPNTPKSHDSNSPVMQTIVADPSNPSTPTLTLQRPPTPLRKNTDTSIVSNGSDSDSSTLRKSALRRSSSSASHSILSPRKVRFALEGQEYPTDSSPQPPTIEEELPKRNTITLGWYNNDSDDEAGSEQVENIEEPPPKRISSSQALRALSRGPLADDDGTKWTEVAAPPDGSASVPLDEAMKNTKDYIDADDDETRENVTLDTGVDTEKSDDKGLENLSETDINDSFQREAFQKERKEASAREPRATNSIPIKSSESPKMNGKTTDQSQDKTSQTTRTSSVNAPSAPRRSKSTFSLGESDSESESENEQDTKSDDDDDEPMFEFEEGTESRNKKENMSEKTKTRSDISRFSPSDLISPRKSSFGQSEITGSSFRSGSLGKQSTGASGSYGTSGSLQRVSRGSDAGNGQTVGTPSGIDYSYKGNLAPRHPFNQPIVNERVQHEASKMGNFQSWVGSVDGRSGVDDRQGDSGFRGSLGIGSSSLREGGHPRSLSEKLMMEEEMEEKQKAEAEAQAKK